MAGVNPVPLRDLKNLPYSLQEWMRSVTQLLNPGGSGLIPWAQVDKTGSTLTDLVTRNHNNLQNIQGGASSEYYHLTSTQHGILSVATAGTYTPTLTNTTNLSASTAYQCQYMRVGSVVTVSGKVDVDPTGAGSCVLGVTLPVSSDIGAQEDVAGTAACPAVSGTAVAILGDVTNNRATFEWIAVDTANRSLFFTFTYRVI